jgi:hypothetical protein
MGRLRTLTTTRTLQRRMMNDNKMLREMASTVYFQKLSPQKKKKGHSTVQDFNPVPFRQTAGM